jgi:hypothetical protein
MSKEVKKTGPGNPVATTTPTTPEETPRTAKERLEDLEVTMAQLLNVSDYVTKDIMNLKTALKLLHGKVDAIVKASVAGEEITDPTLERIMQESSVAELANRVTNLIVTGLITKEEQVSGNSFLVGCQVDDDGTVKNPRVQFSLKSLTPEFQAKLTGGKAGDSFKFKDTDTVSFKLLESYKIAEEPAANPTPVPQPEAPAPAPTVES